MGSYDRTQQDFTRTFVEQVGAKGNYDLPN